MKFIIKLLSSMGLGVNGYMLSIPSFLFNLGRQFPWAKFSLEDSSSNQIIIKVVTDDEVSYLTYTLKGNKIVNVQYHMGT